MPTVNFIESAPPEGLAAYVEAFWHCQITEKGAIRLLPTACSELMACYTSLGNRVVLVGPMSVSQTAHVTPGELFVGVRFRPGCQITLQQQGYTSLKDTKVYGRATNSTLVNDFETDMQSMATPEAVKIRLQSLVVALVAQRRIVRDAVIDDFLSMSEARSGHIKIKDSLKDLPISPRQFRRRFKQYTAYTPKEFLRLCRQQRAVAELKKTNATITDIAAKHGYADHAHFSHEFRALVGIAPMAFEKELTLK